MNPAIRLAARISLDVASAHYTNALRMALAAGVEPQALLEETWKLVAEVLLTVDGVRAVTARTGPPSG